MPRMVNQSCEFQIGFGFLSDPLFDITIGPNPQIFNLFRGEHHVLFK